MTLASILDQAYHELRSVDGLDQFPMRESANIAHNRIHQQLLVEEAQTTESFTWAVADGTDKDVSSALTRWRAQPAWITSADSDYEWERRSITEIRRRRTSTTTDENLGSHFVYAVRGNYLMIVNTPTSALTVTCIHYQSPAELDDLTDEPMLPEEFHDILVDAVVRDMWAYARKMSGGAYDRRKPWPEEEEAAQRFIEKWKALTARVRKTRQVKHRMQPGPIFAAAATNMVKRRMI